MEYTLATWFFTSLGITTAIFLPLQAHYNRAFRRCRGGRQAYSGGYTNHQLNIWGKSRFCVTQPSGANEYKLQDTLIRAPYTPPPMSDAAVQIERERQAQVSDIFLKYWRETSPELSSVSQ